MSIRPKPSLLNPALQRPSALKSTPRDPALLWLDKNENLDPELLALSHRILQELPPASLATYPEAGEIYRKLGRWAGVDPANLLLTPGSDGAIRLAFDAFVEPGDDVIHTEPTFAMYPVYSLMFGAQALRVEYARGDRGPLLDTEAIFTALRTRKPKLLCLPNPDSPTGTTLAPEVLRRLLAECEANGTVLLLDEAYHPFYERSAIEWTNESRNLIVARTFAKAWGAAGLRIGYAAAHPETCALLHKLRPMYEVSTVAVEFMSRMLDHQDAMQACVKRINDGQAWFVDEMRALGFDALPTAGNFVHVAFGEKAPAVHAALAGKVYYRANFDLPCLAGYSRFTTAPRSIMREVVALVQSAVKSTQ